jgi:predicted O-methyltransferase YrrM
MKFSQDWTAGHVEVWEQVLNELKDTPVRYLEIGVFEGRTLCWMLQNVLTHSSSRATAVDPFTGSIEHASEEIAINTLRDRFFENIAPWRERVTVYEGTNKRWLPELLRSHQKYNLIYVDGSHMGQDVLFDAVMAWEMLDPNGILVFDDYEWDMYRDHRMTPKVAIDSFLATIEGDYVLLKKYWGVIIRKATILPMDATTDPESICGRALALKNLLPE